MMKKWIGCPCDTGTKLTVIMLDYIDVTKEQTAKDVGIGCVCTLCKKLKTMEDNWIMTFSTFNFKESHQQLVIGNCFIFS